MLNLVSFDVHIALKSSTPKFCSVPLCFRSAGFFTALALKALLKRRVNLSVRCYKEKKVNKLSIAQTALTNFPISLEGVGTPSWQKKKNPESSLGHADSNQQKVLKTC